ncbi:MAG TPA: hypothetical protein VMT80_00050 [Candidatus Paceibacterota bacterium]|nr:hypothetical protein [Candidatus Paceibacterota bacterium]
MPHIYFSIRERGGEGIVLPLPAMMGRDLAREQDLLDRVNAVVVNGVPVREWRNDGVLVWQRFQQPLLFADIPSFYAGKRSAEERSTRTRTPFLGFAALLITAYASARMLLARPRVFVFSIDKASDPISQSDARIAPVYAALRETGTSFIECFHTTIDEFWRGFVLRGRSALYLESFDLLWRLKQLVPGLREPSPALSFGALPPGTPEEQAFMKAVVSKYLGSLPRHAFRARMLERLLKRARPDVAFLVDDTRHYHDAVNALHSAGVPSYAVQHGQFTKRHAGWRRFPGIEGEYERADAMLVWNEHWKRALSSLDAVFPDEAVLIAGNPTALDALRRRPEAPLAVLVPFESEGPFELMKRILKTLSESRARILFKPRLDRDVHEQLARYGLPIGTELVRELDSYQGEVSVALGSYTTLLYELCARGIPVALLRAPGVPENSMAEEGLAEPLSPEESDILGALARIANLPDAVVDERSRRLKAPMQFKDSVNGLIQKHAHARP